MKAGLAAAVGALATLLGTLLVALLVTFFVASPSAAAEGRGGRGGRGGRRRRPAGKEPSVGQPAPDFELVKLDAKGDSKSGAKAGAKAGDKAEKETVRLSSFKGKRPVVLVFSSYT